MRSCARLFDGEAEAERFSKSHCDEWRFRKGRAKRSLKAVLLEIQNVLSLSLSLSLERERTERGTFDDFDDIFYVSEFFS